MRFIKSICLIFFCAGCFIPAAHAGPFEDGQAAYDQHDYQTALQLWQPLAEQGNAGAQYNLGIMYDNGFGMKANPHQAVEWFRRAAVQGNKAAERHYEADNFSLNLGLPPVAEAKASDSIVAAEDIPHIFKIEPAAGEAAQQPIQLAPAAADISDIQILNAMAARGDAEAQLRLGNIYALGKAVPQDYEQAAQWYTKAAALGNADAQELLGTFYNLGVGVHQDYTEAALLYRLSADQGNANAQDELATLYVLGRGVTQDYTLAAQWYAKAAAQGHADAETELGSLYAAGVGVPQDNAEAKKWYSLAAAQGNKTAQNELDLLSASEVVAPQRDVLQKSDLQRAAAGTVPVGKDGLPQTLHERTAPQQISLATQQGFDIGADISTYRYRESNPYATAPYNPPDPFMVQTGAKAGVEAGYTYVADPYGAFTRAEGRYATGVVNYAGNAIRHNQPDNLAEARILEGTDFDLGSSDLSPYAGYGFRYLYNDIQGAGGYLRESHYQYIPFGATDRFRLGDQARIAANLEYDLFAGGVQKSFRFVSDPTEPQILNHQSGGFGTRGSLLFEAAGWQVGPWFDYWHIRMSDFVPTPGGSAGEVSFEPNNSTTEVGLKVIRNFW